MTRRWDSLPTDLAHCILDVAVPYCGPSLAVASRDIHDYVTRLLYRRVALRSLTQLSLFLQEESGAFKHGRLVRSFSVHIPGVPGGGAIPSYARERLLENVARALVACSASVRVIEFSFYSTAFSRPFATEIAPAAVQATQQLSSAIGACTTLESFTWKPPDSVHVVRGLSIAIVDQLVPAIVEAVRLLSPHNRLRRLELHNVKFMEYTGLDRQRSDCAVEERGRSTDLAHAITLCHSIEILVISSAVNLSHAAVAMVLHSRFITVEISDGFAESLWGPRLSAAGVSDALTLTGTCDEADVTVALSKLKIHVRAGPVDGIMSFA